MTRKIIGDNYTKTEIYNGVFLYKCQDGFHFESYGFNYGNTIYGTDDLMNNYIIKEDL